MRPPIVPPELEPLDHTIGHKIGLSCSRSLIDATLVNRERALAHSVRTAFVTRDAGITNDNSYLQYKPQKYTNE